MRIMLNPPDNKGDVFLLKSLWNTTSFSLFCAFFRPVKSASSFKRRIFITAYDPLTIILYKI